MNDETPTAERGEDVIECGAQHELEPGNPPTGQA
jgi:hypothetical protein